VFDIYRRRLFSRKTQSDRSSPLPWLSQPIRFTEDCTRCGKCIESCDTKIITKSDGGFPAVDFSIDECTFCYKCAEACPEPLFLTKEAPPWQVKANINDSCLTKQNVECRCCGDLCDSIAIKFKLELGKVAQPDVDLDECNGCGACVSVCPTSSINVSNITA